MGTELTIISAAKESAALINECLQIAKTRGTLNSVKKKELKLKTEAYLFLVRASVRETATEGAIQMTIKLNNYIEKNNLTGDQLVWALGMLRDYSNDLAEDLRKIGKKGLLG